MAYTTAEEVIKFLDDVNVSDIDPILIEYADSLIDELTERDFLKHENYSERLRIKQNNVDSIIVENHPLLDIASIKVNDETIDSNNYFPEDDSGIIDFENLLLEKSDILIIIYDYGYETVPILIRQISTLLTAGMYKQNQTNASSGNSGLIPKSKKFANYSVSYGSISDVVQSVKNSNKKNLLSLIDKVALLERNYRK